MLKGGLVVGMFMVAFFVLAQSGEAKPPPTPPPTKISKASRTVEERIGHCRSFDCILKAGEQSPSLCHLKAHDRFTRAIVECDATCKALRAADPEAFDCWRIESCKDDVECASLFGIQASSKHEPRTDDDAYLIAHYINVLGKPKADFRRLCNRVGWLSKDTQNVLTCTTPNAQTKTVSAHYEGSSGVGWIATYRDPSEALRMKRQVTEGFGTPTEKREEGGCTLWGWEPSTSSLVYVIGKCADKAWFGVRFQDGK
jgi:hypothetical protein